jgi:DNA-binding NtrC family response regulator
MTPGRARARARTLRKQGDLAGARAELEAALDGASPVERAAIEADLGELPTEAAPASPVIEPPDADGIAGVGPATAELRRSIARAAKTKIAVLVTGGSGSGKELVARAIHRRSSRANEPFAVLSASGFTPGMVEDELFGHVPGAFTGATTAREGVLVEAGRGTLLLDGIDDMPLDIQAKLLRVLENGEGRRLGASASFKVEARFVATARRPLGPLVRNGTFREDLLYRLTVLEIPIAPLRERPEDIPSLVAALLARHAKGPVPPIEPAALACLQRHAWPGNVRELENELRRLLVIGGGAIVAANIAPAIRRGLVGKSELSTGLYEKLRGRTLEDVERAAIQAALRASRGNRTQAARLLNLPRRTLYDMMKRLEIDAG